MDKLLAILALVVVVTGNPVKVTIKNVVGRMDGRIVGGDSATIEEAPYQVSLQLDGEHFCGGSIIAKNWVLTAGHCVSYGIESMTIRSGSTNVNNGTVHRVQQVIRHYDYGNTDNYLPMNDIALLRVADSDSFQFNNEQKSIKLFEGNSSSLVGQYGLVTGWGTTDQGVPTNLQKVSVPIISKQECDDSYRDTDGEIPFGEICAGYKAGGKDSCQGDSGGPLVVNGYLVGIVSWGNGCGSPKFPGVYTDVGYYRQWVRENASV